MGELAVLAQKLDDEEARQEGEKELEDGSTERDSREPFQDDGDLSTMPEADDELANFLMEMDEDGDGLLTYDELHAGLLVHLEDEDEELLPTLQQYFLEADEDGDSKLGPEELAVLAQKMDDEEARQEGEQELEDGSTERDSPEIFQDGGDISTMPEADD